MNSTEVNFVPLSTTENFLFLIFWGPRSPHCCFSPAVQKLSVAGKNDDCNQVSSQWNRFKSKGLDHKSNSNFVSDVQLNIVWADEHQCPLSSDCLIHIRNVIRENKKQNKGSSRLSHLLLLNFLKTTASLWLVPFSAIHKYSITQHSDRQMDTLNKSPATNITLTYEPLNPQAIALFLSCPHTRHTHSHWLHPAGMYNQYLLGSSIFTSD